MKKSSEPTNPESIMQDYDVDSMFVDKETFFSSS